MNKPGLSVEDFEQQFPHQEKYEDPGKPVTPWWELAHAGDRGAYKGGGTVVHNAMKMSTKAIKGK